MREITRAFVESAGQAVVGLPPGPSAPVVVQTYLWLRDPLRMLDDCARRFGDIFTIRLVGTAPWVFVWSPALLKAAFTAPPDVVHAGEANFALWGPIAGDASVLTMDEGAHMGRRRLLLPQFHGDRMQVYVEQLRDIAMRTVQRWPSGVAFRMDRETQRMALDAIMRTVFGVRVDRGGVGGVGGALGARGGGEEAGLVRALTELADKAVRSRLMLVPPLQRDWGAWSPWGRVVRIIRRADQALYAEIARRRAGACGASEGEDILSLLLQVRDEDGVRLTDREVRDELVVMLMAGHETTSNALAWVFERILSLPEVEARIREELAAVSGSGEFRAEHLGRLEYLDAVIKESLRSRPIMPGGGARLVRGAFEIGGFVIPPGAILVNAHYLLHRRPELYPEPDVFRPERFLGKRAVDPYEWAPFGGGTRRCLGYSFALFEMKVFLATVLSKLRLRIETPDAVMQRRGFFLAPAGGPRVVRVG